MPYVSFMSKMTKYHILHICYRAHVLYRYGNMGVKRCVRSWGMQTNDIRQLLNGLNGKKAIFDIYIIRYMSYIDMAIWVSKDTSGPQECRTMWINKFWIGLMAQNYKNNNFHIFPLYFSEFSLYFKNALSKVEKQSQKLLFMFLDSVGP